MGDTGELDGQAGELMLARHPDLCAAVLLHCVGTDAGGRGVAVPEGYCVNGRPVRFFRTYVMAAFHALDLGLMGEDGFERVVEAALRDVGDADDGRGRRADVVADVEDARERLARRH